MSSDSKEPSADQAAPFDWRKHLPVHPAAEFFPLLKDTDPSGFKGLVEDIRVRGLIEPIVGWSSSEGVSVLDGRNRLDALAQLGLLHETHDHHVGIKKWTGKEWRDRRSGAGEVRIDGYEGGVFRSLYERDGLDPYALALSLNVHRRHLNAEQKRDLIAKVLKARPEASDHSIGKQTGSDDKTVTSVRRELESNSEIPNKTERVEASGRKARGRKAGQPAKKKQASSIEERDRKECVRLHQKSQDAKRERAQWIADHPSSTEDDAARLSCGTRERDDDLDDNFYSAVLWEEPEDMGRFLEKLGPDRFFEALAYAPKLRAEIERHLLVRTEGAAE
jgi:hypothetical protein